MNVKSHFFTSKELSAWLLRMGDTFADGNRSYMLALSMGLALAGCAMKTAPGLDTYIKDGASGYDVWHENAKMRVVQLRAGSLGGPVHIYIEGDGRAYIDRATPSGDPTPVSPVALKLALSDSTEGARVVYVGRPCQWQPAGETGCRDSTLWTTRRFDRAVLDTQVGVIAGQVGTAREVMLIGFSGGARVAMEAATKLGYGSFRPGLKHMALVTVAGNVDPAAVNAFHRVPTPASWVPVEGLMLSLNRVLQIHYVGRRDEIVPPQIAKDFSRKMEAIGGVAEVREIDATHLEGWDALGF